MGTEVLDSHSRPPGLGSIMVLADLIAISCRACLNDTQCASLGLHLWPAAPSRVSTACGGPSEHEGELWW